MGLITPATGWTAALTQDSRHQLELIVAIWASSREKRMGHDQLNLGQVVGLREHTVRGSI